MLGAPYARAHKTHPEQARYEDIAPEHKGKILRAFQFVVDKLDADGAFVKCKSNRLLREPACPYPPQRRID